MAYSIKEAKELVIRAGKILVESGLIARTWGNISARISDTQFVITPSGLAYETLTPEQIVTVNIIDCNYEGKIKPSSEKGIHADAYRLRPEVNFIIHTHQELASVISMEGLNLIVHNSEDTKILGDLIPCAAYGMPSTGKLRKAVAMAVDQYPRSKAFLMKYHGTLCLGHDLDHAFLIAKTLEKVAGERYQKACGLVSKTRTRVVDYGSSERRGNVFQLKCNGIVTEYKIDNANMGGPKEAILHGQIYKSSKVNYIIHTVDQDVVEVSTTGRMLRPFIDDLAQIAGINIKPVKAALDHPKSVAKQLKRKNAVLLENAGALCTGITESDAIAVGMVLKKGCAADLYSAAVRNVTYLNSVDAHIQRMIYVAKYSKQKK